jgi:hypothetical protein
MHHEPPVWVGTVHGREVRRRTRDGCVNALRRLAGEDASLWIEITPEVVGVSEAATILGWDRRRVATYVSRGAFPEPIAALASGRVWRREDVEAFGRDYAQALWSLCRGAASPQWRVGRTCELMVSADATKNVRARLFFSPEVTSC